MRPRSQQRKCQFLILHEAGETESRAQHPIAAEREIVEMPALEKLVIGFRMTVFELHPVAGRKRICRPTLHAAAVASNPIADQVAIVGVSATIAAVVVDEPRTEFDRMVRAVNSFHTQFELGELWRPGLV